MSSVKLKAPLGGSVTLSSVDTAVDYTLTVPAANATVITSSNLASNIGSALPAGSIVQIVSSTTTTRDTSTNASYVDTSLSASITPTSSSNKILVIVSYTLANSNSSYAAWSQLVRDSTSIAQRTYYTAASNSYASMDATLSILDSPATTSSVTYKMQIRPDGASAGTVTFNGPTTMSYSSGTPTNHSTITLMEVKV